MKLRTSFCNPTLFKKNLTRFAPAWLLYTLCLMLGLVLLYSDGNDTTRVFWFASRMGEAIQWLALVNLFWAPLCAMLLFGDLWNSRMCNALHAMPLRRECIFFTNVLSGLTFNAIPTGIMALVALPLLTQTCVVNAWQIALWFFLGANLSFLCFFGIAVFSVFTAGNRLAMGLIYALLNGGAFLIYWLVDTVYTPMLYGVITPYRLTELLSPIANMVDNSFVEITPFSDLRELYGNNTDQMTAVYWLTKDWLYLTVYALIGCGLGLLGLVMYRRRNLECAGDMMAFRFLEPVFVVLFSVLAATGVQFFFYTFLGFRGLNLMLLAAGLMAGWFGAHMLVARTTRVFRLKNWLGLAGLAVCAALTLAATHFDIFGIADWMPDISNVRSASVSNYYGYSDMELTDEADIRNILRLHELALLEHREESGDFPLDESVTYVERIGYCYPDGTPYDGEFYYVSSLQISYTLNSGKVVRRSYPVLLVGEARTLANEYLSRWESYEGSSLHVLMEQPGFRNPQSVSIFETEIPEQFLTPEDMDALAAAIRADFDERHMTQNSYFHDGHFYKTTEDGDLMITRGMWLNVHMTDSGFGIDFYADSRNILAWCQERGLMNGWEVSDKNVYGG